MGGDIPQPLDLQREMDSPNRHQEQYNENHRVQVDDLVSNMNDMGLNNNHNHGRNQERQRENERGREEEAEAAEEAFRDVDLSIMDLVNLRNLHGEKEVTPVTDIHARFVREIVFDEHGVCAQPTGVCWDPTFSFFLVAIDATKEVKCIGIEDDVDDINIIDVEKFPTLKGPGAVTVVHPGRMYAVLDVNRIIVCRYDHVTGGFTYEVAIEGLSHCRGLATTPQGKVVSAGRKCIYMWDVETKQQLQAVNYPVIPPGYGNCSFLSCGGNRLIVTDLGRGSYGTSAHGLMHIFTIKPTTKDDGTVEEIISFERDYLGETDDYHLGRFRFISGSAVDMNNWSIISDAGKDRRVYDTRNRPRPNNVDKGETTSLQIFNDQMTPVGFINFDAEHPQKYTADIAITGRGYMLLTHRKHSCSIFKLERRPGEEDWPSNNNNNRTVVPIRGPTMQAYGSGGYGINGGRPSVFGNNSSPNPSVRGRGRLPPRTTPMVPSPNGYGVMPMGTPVNQGPALGFGGRPFPHPNHVPSTGRVVMATAFSNSFADPPNRYEGGHVQNTGFGGRPANTTPVVRRGSEMSWWSGTNHNWGIGQPTGYRNNGTQFG